MSQLHHHLEKPAGLWQQHPVLVQLLGLSPLLGGSKDIYSATVLGIGTLLILCASAIIVSLLRHRLPQEWRFAGFLAVTSLLTLILSFILSLANPALLDGMGIYLPLIACNYLVLMELERSAFRQAVLQSMRAALISGAGFTVLLVLFSLTRILMVTVLDALPLAEDSLDYLVFSPGFGFILLGLFVAAGQYLHQRYPFCEVAVKPARRLRATGPVR